MPVTEIIALGLEIIPKLVSAGMDITRTIQIMRKANDDGKIDDAEWDELKAIEDGLRTKLHSDTE
jgi:hypothetical protein